MDHHPMRERATSHNEVMRHRSLIQAGALFVWITLVAIVGVLVIYSRIHSTWILTTAQVLLYFTMVLPILVWARNTFHDFASPRWQRFAALLLVAISLIAAAVVQHYGIELIGIAFRVGATAVSEELIFRGFIWDRIKRAGWGSLLVIVVNVVAFTLWHIPAMLTGNSQASVGGFAVLLLTGLTLCILRLVTRSLILPAATHFAIDIF
jgi:membrane protease YdiL (CAAX protease family)